MNSMQLKDKLRNISKTKNIDFNTLLRLYMYERFLERLSKSKYQDNFILKGGFYLSTLFGLENRSTMDIDVALKNAKFTEKNILKIIKEVIDIDINDNCKMTFIGIEPIREEDEYGGFRIELCITLERVREKFHLDIATGDPITPKEITYNYMPLLSNNSIKLWAYNLETVLAEKLETVFNRLELNGRMRDYYDLYLIYIKDWNNININHLRQAVQNTFTKRGFHKSLIESFRIIKNSSVLQERWKAYSKKYDYASEINFETILQYLETIINTIEKATV